MFLSAGWRTALASVSTNPKQSERSQKREGAASQLRVIPHPVIEFISLNIDWYYRAGTQPLRCVNPPEEMKAALAAPLPGGGAAWRRRASSAVVTLCRRSIKQTKVSLACLIESPFLSERDSKAPPASLYRRGRVASKRLRDASVLLIAGLPGSHLTGTNQC